MGKHKIKKYHAIPAPSKNFIAVIKSNKKTAYMF